MNCPKCGIALEYVERPDWMNSHQWDAVKAGDWCRDTSACEHDGCPCNRQGANPQYRYATDRGLAAYSDAEAARMGWQ